MKKSLILTGAVALFSLIASAKSYEIALSGPTYAGNVQLKAGEYNVKVKGNTATFTNQDTFKTYTAPVKIEQTPSKFDQTAVDTSKQDGSDHIQRIQLGGSSTQLDFGE
jgi:hypothetical protein